MDFVEYICKMKWRWAGHVARMTDNRWTIHSTEWTPRDGRRSVGRPPKRWMDDIASYLCSIDIINGKLWHRYAQNRSLWNRLMEGYIRRWVD